jgi:outer membrane autotransporter protein
MSTPIPFRSIPSCAPHPAQSASTPLRGQSASKLSLVLCSLLLSAPCALSHATETEEKSPASSTTAIRAVRDGAVITTDGAQEYGVEFRSSEFTPQENAAGTEMFVRDSRITTHGDKSSGVVAHIMSGRKVRVEGTVIDTTGHMAAGIELTRSPIAAAETRITTHGANSPALVIIDAKTLRSPDSPDLAGTEAKAVSQIQGGELRTEGDKSPGVISLTSPISMHHATVTTTGAESPAILAHGSSVELQNVHLNARGDLSAAAIISGGTLEAKDSVIGSDRHSAIVVTDDSGSDANIVLRNTRVQDLGTAGAFVDVQTPRNLLAGKVQILLADQTEAYGDIVRSGAADDSHPIDLAMANSSWRGKTTALNRVSLANSKWELSGDSQVNSMTMLGGRVIFDPIGDTTAHTLTIANDLNGNGAFSMNADFAKQQANRVVVQGKANGAFNLQVQTSGQEPDRNNAALNLVQTHGGDATFTLANRGARAELGVYQYELQRQEADGKITWDLVAAADKPAAPTPPTQGGPTQGPAGSTAPAMTSSEPPAEHVTPAAIAASGEAASTDATVTPAATAATGATVTPKSTGGATTTAAGAAAAKNNAPAPAGQPRTLRPRLSSLASAVVNTSSFATTQRIWNTEIGALGWRADALRNGATGSGLWADGFDARQQFANGTGRDFSQKLDGFHIGADRVIAVEGGRWNVGIAGGSSRTKRDFSEEGKGSTTGLHAGIYAGMQHDSGVYAQGAISAGRFNNRINAIGTDYRSTNAQFKNKGVGLSLTVGKRWDLAGGWFAEPQAGVDYFHLGNARYRTSNGMTVDARSTESVQLRGALRLGKRFDLASGGDVTPYVQIGGVQEFGGNSRTTINGIRLDSRVAGARLETSVGVNANLGKQHSLFAGYSHSKGSNYEQPWALNLGYRYAF